MFFIVYVIATLAGQIVSLGNFNQAFSTEQACNDARPAVIAKANEQLKPQGAKMDALCLSKEDMDKLRAKIEHKDNGSI